MPRKRSEHSVRLDTLPHVRGSDTSRQAASSRVP